MQKTKRRNYEYIIETTLLWRIFPAEQYRPVLKEYREKHKQNIKNYEDFIQKIGSPLDKEFIKIMDEQIDVLPLDFFQVFLDGFKLGAKMIIEIYSDGEEKIEMDL